MCDRYLTFYAETQISHWEQHVSTRVLVPTQYTVLTTPRIIQQYYKRTELASKPNVYPLKDGNLIYTLKADKSRINCAPSQYIYSIIYKSEK